MKGDLPSSIRQSAEEYCDEKMFCGDQLFPIAKENMGHQRHKHIGALTFQSTKSPILGKGTGTLISPNLVLTAAHNLYDKETHQFYFDFKFYLAQSGPLQNYYQIEDFHIPGKYILFQKSTDDYALLKLKGKVQVEDFIQLSCDYTKITNQAKLTICGYPGAEYRPTDISGEGDKVTLSQFGLTKSGRVLELRQKKAELIHHVSTQEGQSGTALILEEGSKLKIMGVHKGGIKQTRVKEELISANSATLLSPELIKSLKLEAESMGAQMFLVEPSNKLFTPMSASGDRKEQSAKATKLFNSGKELQKNKRVEEAVACYLQAVEEDSRYLQAYFSLGCVFVEMKELDQAIQCFHKVLEIEPSNIKAHHRLADVFIKIEQLESALNYYKKAIKINPQEETTFLKLELLLDQWTDVSKIWQVTVFLQSLAKKSAQNTTLMKYIKKFKLVIGLK